MARLHKKVLIPLVAIVVVLLYLSTLPLITVQKFNFIESAPEVLGAYALSVPEGNVLNFQVNLDGLSLESQGYRLNATSAKMSLNGIKQPDGSVKLEINLDLKSLDVKSGDIRVKIANGVLTGNIVATKDNKIIANLEAKTSVVDIIRSLLGT